jgi:hypothetical protein
LCPAFTMYCVLQPSCIVFCRHYALYPAVSLIVSAVTVQCFAVVMHYVLQSLRFIFGCRKLCSAVIMCCVLQA